MRWRILSLIPPAGMFSAPGTAPSAVFGVALARAASTASDWAESADADLVLRDMEKERGDRANSEERNGQTAAAKTSGVRSCRCNSERSFKSEIGSDSLSA